MAIPDLASAEALRTADFQSNSLGRLMLRRLFRQRSALVGMTLLGFLLLVAIFADVIAPYSPTEVLIGKEPVRRREAPCIHLLGCPRDRPQHIMGIDGNVVISSAGLSSAPVSPSSLASARLVLPLSLVRSWDPWPAILERL
jgi:hypothetical protein